MASSTFPTFTTVLDDITYKVDSDDQGYYRCPCRKHQNSQPPQMYDWEGINAHFTSWLNISVQKVTSALLLAFLYLIFVCSYSPTTFGYISFFLSLRVDTYLATLDPI
jgi:hypothetical protein